MQFLLRPDCCETNIYKDVLLCHTNNIVKKITMLYHDLYTYGKNYTKNMLYHEND
jgi:hypothetical protein